MALTQTNSTSSGTLTNLAGVYTSTGTVDVTGSGAITSLAVASGTLTINNSSVSFATLAAVAGATIDIVNSTVTVAATAAAGALNNFVIGTGGTLTLGSAVAIAAGQTISFTDGTGKLELASGLAGVNVAGSIAGYTDGDQITLDGSAYDPSSSSYNAATGALTLVGINGTPNTTLTVDLASTAAAPQYFNLAEVNGNETVMLSSTPTAGSTIPACYVAGTLITTDHGDVAVEDLAIGDRVMTVSGSAEEILWIGRRSYNGRLLAGRPELLPVVFKQGSLGRNLPRRDLKVSPKHAMYLRGALVPAECLVNGTTIVRDAAPAALHYFHIELDHHDVLLAEGAPSETYVNDYDRGVFHNSATFAELYPARDAGECVYFARHVEHGAELEAIRAALLRRAAALPAKKAA